MPLATRCPSQSSSPSLSIGSGAIEHLQPVDPGKLQVEKDETWHLLQPRAVEPITLQISEGLFTVGGEGKVMLDAQVRQGGLGQGDVVQVVFDEENRLGAISAPEGEVERRALAGNGVGPVPPAMALDDATDRGEADARPFELVRPVQALEGEEELRLEERVEADAVVAHEEHLFRHRLARCPPRSGGSPACA